MESKNASALVVKGLSRLPVTEEIAGSNPVERATKKRHQSDDVFSWRAFDVRLSRCYIDYKPASRSHRPEQRRAVVSITIVSGDIVRVPADAIITSIGVDGGWTGGVNHAIQQAAGTMFHDQLRASLPLADGQIVLTVPDVPTYRGMFRNVLFLADARARPLGEIVLLALQEAERLGMGTLSLPALRTGAAAGEYERSSLEVAQQLCAAAQDFAASKPRCVKQVQFVILGDTSMQCILSWMLARGSILL